MQAIDMRFYNLMVAALLGIACYTNAFAQVSGALKVGDNVPDVMIRKVLNSEQQTLALGSFRGKYLILDFWATWCAPCLQAFPRLDSLQQRFKNDVVVLGITREQEARVRETLTSLPSLKGMTLKIVAEDTVLHRLFPHSMVPHEVIIDRQGKVLAITDAESINISVIEKLIAQQRQAFYEKKSVLKFNYDAPLFADTLYANKIKYYSVIGSYIPGLLGSSGRRGVDDSKPENDTAYYATNLFGMHLLRIANNKGSMREQLFVDNRIIYQTKFPEKFIMPNDPARKVFEPWALKNNVCYSIMIPSSEAGTLYQRMKADIERYYNVVSYLRVMKRSCYVITAIDSVKLCSVGGKSRIDKTAARWSFQNYSVNGKNGGAGVIQEMNFRSPKPVVYEAGGNPKISFDFIPDFSDFAKLQKELATKGMIIVKAKRRIEMMIIKDNIK